MGGNKVREEMQSPVMLVTMKALAFILSDIGCHPRVFNRKVTISLVFLKENSGCCAEHRGKEGSGGAGRVNRKCLQY